MRGVSLSAAARGYDASFQTSAPELVVSWEFGRKDLSFPGMKPSVAYRVRIKVCQGQG